MLFHRRSTTVSLEITPFIHMQGRSSLHGHDTLISHRHKRSRNTLRYSSTSFSEEFQNFSLWSCMKFYNYSSGLALIFCMLVLSFNLTTLNYMVILVTSTLHSAFQNDAKLQTYVTAWQVVTVRWVSFQSEIERPYQTL